MARIEAGALGELLPKGSFLVRDPGRGLDLKDHEEIAAAAGFQRQAVSPKPQAMPPLGTGGDFDLERAGEGRNGNRRSQHGFPRGEFEFVVEVVAFDLEVGVGGEADAEVEISGGTAADAGLAAAR